mmetsp:Transcript_37335/g.52709  ORF Transcript_37335/g.52709 Transcript_37335/m.52709 type:complete len:81 (+) Transcript_37335:311-553(+)
MHAYLPTTEKWLIDLGSRSPSTYGTKETFTKFNGTLKSSNKRLRERKDNQGRMAELSSFLYWPNGEKCSLQLMTKKKFKQ